MAVVWPENIQMQAEHNLEVAQGLTLVIAFLGGILSIFSPCLLPFLPAFFAYSFKEKKRLSLMTLAFFAGFTPVFFVFGILAALIGNFLTPFLPFLIGVAGVLLVFFGVMSLLGRGFSGLKISRKTNVKDVKDVFILGVLFALGWAACLGPILGSIIILAGISGSVWYAGLLTFTYSLGLFVPLFVLSVLLDTTKIVQHPFFSKKLFSLNIFGSEVDVFFANALSGVLLIFLGLLFLLFQGTSIFNSFDFLGTKDLFYEFQRQLLQ
ncbi:MAG: cytochrome c biogenesis CcdA family protein [Candidatus Micrarchaeia archaeon]